MPKNLAQVSTSAFVSRLRRSLRSHILSNRVKRRRGLQIESLESRQVLAGLPSGETIVQTYFVPLPEDKTRTL